MNSTQLQLIAGQLLAAAIDQARKGLAEGGIPIGAALFVGMEPVAVGRNRRIQLSDPILHAEMDTFRSAGRHSAKAYREMTLVSTLSPCAMCTGATLLFGVPRVVIGESETFRGPEELLEQAGVELVRMDSLECRQLLGSFIGTHPDDWQEDIGVGGTPR